MVEEVNFEVLPNSFVIKATYGYKMNYIVSDKSSMDENACRRELREWLNTTFGTYTVEAHYCAEKYGLQ